METNKRQPTQIPTPSQLRLLLGTAVLLLVIGGALLAFGFFFVQEANASRNWPAVTGRIQNVRVTWGLSNSQEAMPDREYYFEVQYAYEVDGQTYSGDRYSLGDGSNAAGRTYNSEDEAHEAAAAAYTAGSDITVYYDPAAPEMAVIQPGASFGTYAPLLLGIFFLLGGVAFWRLYSRRKALLSGSETI